MRNDQAYASSLLASHSSFHRLPLFIISRKTISPKMLDAMRFTTRRRERSLMCLSFLWYGESKAPAGATLSRSVVPSWLETACCKRLLM
jgi:hypothetical protein